MADSFGCTMLCCAPAPAAVIDLETTGLAPGRIVEVAIRLLDADGRIEGELTTLLNPGPGGVGPTHIHRITDQDVAHAPSFAQAAGNLADALQGRVLVAHNVAFETGFLRAEFSRIGVTWPTCRLACTMAGAHVLGQLESRKLANVCDVLGITLLNAHTAGGDADATTQVLLAELAHARSTGQHLPPPSGIAATDVLPVLDLPGRHRMTRAARLMERDPARS